jgi:hypothetical protein
MSYINNFLKTEPNENNKLYFDRLKKDFNTLINDLNKFEEDGELILESLIKKESSLKNINIVLKNIIIQILKK